MEAILRDVAKLLRVLLEVQGTFILGWGGVSIKRQPSTRIQRNGMKK